MTKCSFCEKPQESAEWLVSGKEALICDECIEIAQEIIDEKRVEARVRKQILEEMAKEEKNTKSSNSLPISEKHNAVEVDV